MRISHRSPDGGESFPSEIPSFGLGVFLMSEPGECKSACLAALAAGYTHIDTARAYGAERTPEFYLIDSSGSVVYRGRLDDSPRDPSHTTSSDLANAMDDLAAGRSVSVSRTDSIGCSVKWKY